MTVEVKDNSQQHADNNEIIIENNNTKNTLDVQFIRPREGPNDGGFRVFIQLDPETQPPIWFRFNKTVIIKAHHKEHGMFTCWSPDFPPGIIDVSVSNDKYTWVHAGNIKYVRDYHNILVGITIFTVIFVMIFHHRIKICLRRNFKRRKEGSDEPFLREEV